MADCGATGSAIDRVARSMAGGSRDGGKVFSNVFGHAANIQQQQNISNMPLTAPEQLSVPTTSTTDTTVPAAASSQQQQQQHRHHQQHMHHDQQGRMMMMQNQHQHHPMMMNNQMIHPQHLAHMQHHEALLMQQQQQMNMMSMMQQQQQQQQQQMMLMRRQQQQQQQHQKAQSQTKVDTKEAVDGPKEEEVVHGHDGIVKPAGIEELAEAWSEAVAVAQDEFDNQTVGHDGVVKPAGIEELAAAWSEAEREYREMIDNNEVDDGIMNFLTKEDEEKYVFKYKDDNTITTEEIQKNNWMDDGIKHFNDGDIQDAIRDFEMELLHCNNNNAVAWHMLGKCYAENDMDTEAIQCLEQAIDRDPYCIAALLDLGVSYVNELNHIKALQNLKAWITHNPKFAGLDIDTAATDDLYGISSSNDNTSSTEGAFDEVQRLLLQALEYTNTYDNNNDDDIITKSEILEVLGVIYNVSRDYDAAIDSFQKACILRNNINNDYTLWNKLGATLANSNNSIDALKAYGNALQIKNKYARAWLNMAISYSNLEQYDDAARCYLQTLSLNPNATHCWSYLRIALSCAEYWDLIPAAAAQDLNAFKPHFNFN